MDIKETKEALAAIKLIAKSGAQIMANGKIGSEDLSVLIALLGQADKIQAGFKGLGEVDDEIKNLDQEEAQEIVRIVFEIFGEVKGALSNE